MGAAVLRWGWLLLTVATQATAATPPADMRDATEDRSVRVDAPQYHRTDWTTQDGAPADIWALAQGRDGYLWLGTGTGLYRFDGVQFEAVRPRERPASNNITALRTTADGALWIGFLLGGASRLKDGKWTHHDVARGAPGAMVLQFAEDDRGVLWAASEAGLYRFHQGRWQQVGKEWGFPSGRAQSVFVDSTGTLWATSQDTLLQLPPGERRFRDTGEPLGILSMVAGAADGTLWVSDGRHGTRALPDARDPARRPRARSETRVAHLANMHLDRWGVLWGTDRTAGGLVRVSGLDRFGDGRSLRESDFDAVVRKSDGLSSDKAVPVLEDREGNVWIGTNLGLHRFRYNNVWALRDARLNQQYTYAIGTAPQGLLVTSAAGLYRVDGRQVSAMAQVQTRNLAGLVATGSRIRVSSPDRLWQWEDGALRPQASPPAVGDAPLTLLRDDGEGGVLAVWNNKGLFRFDGSRWHAIGAGVIQPLHVTALAREAGGAIWLGYPGSIVTRWDAGRQIAYSSRDGLDVGAITAIAPIREGILVAGESGLALLANGRARPLRTHPAEVLDGITGMLEADGSLWLNGMRGVVQVRREDLRRALDDAGHVLPFRLFGAEDGLPGVAQQSPMSPSAVRDPQGRLWFATNQGVAMIDPSRLRTNPVVPPVAIRSLEADRRRYPIAPGLALPEGTRDLRIDYTALSLSLPERLRFRYRLIGVDGEWREAGNRRQAFYTNLGPGRYSFQVMAANDSGVWNPASAVLDFSIRPRFTETWWFAALCVLGIALLLALAYFWRLGQIAERLHARLEERHLERERIARELHDTLLQGVQGLVLRFQAIANRMPAGDPLGIAMENALARADGVITEARDRVQDLRGPDGEMPADLVEAFRQFGQDMMQSYPARFEVVARHALPPLEPLVRDEIYRIGREAILNAFLHARARLIRVEISCDEGEANFRFQDDGDGISPELQGAGRRGHWGLAGMRERARCIGASLALCSRPGEGTAIILKVPVKIAKERTWSALWRSLWPRPPKEPGDE